MYEMDYRAERAERQYREMVEAIEENLGVNDDEDYGREEIFSDIVNYGADTGWGGFTYTVEIDEFYDAHEDAIEDLLYETADSLGAQNSIVLVGSGPYGNHPYKTAAVWFVLVEVADRELNS